MQKSGGIDRPMHLRKMSADWVLICSRGTSWVIFVLGNWIRIQFIAQGIGLRMGRMAVGVAEHDKEVFTF